MNFKIIDLLVLTGGFAKLNLLKEELKNNFNYPYKVFCKNIIFLKILYFIIK